MILTDFLSKKDSFKHFDILTNYNSVLSKSNPTILVYNDDLLVNIREINYISYVSRNAKYKENINGWISSQYVVSLNNISIFKDTCNLSFLSELKIYPNINNKYAGLEDAIYINWNNTIYLCGTRCDIDKEFSRYCIYKLNNNFEILSEIVIRDDKVGHVEKHWSPIEDMPFTFVRWNNPTEIVRVDENTGRIIETITKPQYDTPYKNTRGNCQTIKYKDGYLSIVHLSKRYFNQNSELLPVYKHCFIKYDNEFNIIGISKPFSFEVEDIEFCCGLQKKENEIFVSYSVYDSLPRIIKFNESVLDDIFNIDENNEDFINCYFDNYETGNNLFRNKHYLAAASCFSRIFSNTENKKEEYDSLLKFCACILAVKYRSLDVFTNYNIESFLKKLLLLENNKAEPYYLCAIYYGLIGDFDKKEIFRKFSIQHRFEMPEIKRHLKIW